MALPNATRYSKAEFCHPGLVWIAANFTFNGSSAPDAAEGLPFNTAGTDLARSSEGVYQLTLPGAGTIDVLSAVASLEDSAKALTPRISARVDGSRTLDVTFSQRAGQRLYLPIDKAQDGAANTTTAETAFARAVEAFTVDAVHYVPTGAVTADATNNATITISKYTSAGASKTTVATLVTDVAGGNWTAFAPKAFTLTATTADLSIAAGASFSFEIAKGGTGVQLPAGTIVITGTTGTGGVVADPTDGAKLHVILCIRSRYGV